MRVDRKLAEERDDCDCGKVTGWELPPKVKEILRERKRACESGQGEVKYARMHSINEYIRYQRRMHSMRLSGI
jgi:hypothetical protein